MIAMNDKPKIERQRLPPIVDDFYSVDDVGGLRDDPMPPMDIGNMGALDYQFIGEEAKPAVAIEPGHENASSPAWVRHVSGLPPSELPAATIEPTPSENAQPQSAMIDLAQTRFIVTAWPDHRWPLELVQWIEGLMVGVKPAQPDYRASVKKQNVVCARNWAIKHEALGSHADYQWFVFVDHDVRPCPGTRTSRFLALNADVKCCHVQHGENQSAYSWPTDFHEPIWCTSRRVLEAIEPPWFMQNFNEDATEMAGCICVSFRKKVLEAGFSIANGGWAEHDRDGSWCG